MMKEYKEYWVATEDTATCEVSEFERADTKDVMDLMDWYKVDLCCYDQVHERDVEDGQHIVYDGAIYRGSFGYNLWVTHKYMEL